MDSFRCDPKVIHPIGWDAFGLPAENAARERRIDPGEWTETNISSMRAQLESTGVHFDWEREIKTCDSQYYRWNQWIFLKLYEKGLVKRQLSEVNWDPVDGTVLADEQIDADGKSWRSGAVAEKRTLRQWMIETPKYAKRLSDGLLDLAPQWKDVALIQSNWIGKCDVYRFLFPTIGHSPAASQDGQRVDLRLRDPRKLGSAAFFILGPEHPLADKENKDSTRPYRLPFDVLNGVTGCALPLLVVPTKLLQLAEHFMESRLADPKIDAEWSAELGMELDAPRKTMELSVEDAVEIAKFGGYGGYVTSRIHRDWVVSRQRTWGTPIPMALSVDGRQAAPLSTSQLPVLQGIHPGTPFKHPLLPDGEGILERDTLDTFFDSSWYFLRYLDPRNTDKLVDWEKAKRAMPIDVYVGGIEHAALHMFYARFMAHFLWDIGVCPVREPFDNLIPQGIVRAKTFVVRDSGRFLKAEDVEEDSSKPGQLHEKDTGKPVDALYAKMSKSKHNGVDPIQALTDDGIDLTRLQLLYAARPRSVIDWGEFDTRGLLKWLDRVSRVVSTYINGRRGASKQPENDGQKEEESVDEQRVRLLHMTAVKNATWNLDELQLHRQALCDLMTLTNGLNELSESTFSRSREAERALRSLLVMMQVFAPSAATELWAGMHTVEWIERVNRKGQRIEEQPWPEPDPDTHIDFFLKMHGQKFDSTTHEWKEMASISSEEALHLKRQSLQQSPQHSDHWLATNFAKLESMGHRIVPISRRYRQGIFYELTIDVIPPIARADFKEVIKQQGHSRAKQKKCRQQQHKHHKTAA
ncbi:unnamed protein product, partial [Mesorhabditis spiculigera]